MTRPVPTPGTWGARLREAREAKGWDQKKLGEKVGVTYFTISDWEHNRTRNIPPARLARLASCGGLFKELAEERRAAAAVPPDLADLLATQKELQGGVADLRKLVDALRRRIVALEKRSPPGAADSPQVAAGP